VSRSYRGGDFALETLTVGSEALSVDYDNDGLLTSVGPLVLTRDTETGEIVETTVGDLVTTSETDLFGQLMALRTSGPQGLIFEERVFERDQLGRIKELEITQDGVTTKTEYVYDLAGRLTVPARHVACS
jgi:hypothetical protein